MTSKIKVFLTGHRGFVGKNLLKEFDNEEDKRNYEFDLFNGDICMESSLYSSSICNADVIVHLAGKNKGTDKEIINTNVDGTISLLQIAKNYNIPIILAGTTYEKECSYKDSKNIIKELAKVYSKYYGLRCVVLNIPKVFGPGCKPNYNSFVSTLIWAKANDKLEEYIPLIKNINEELELIHINNLCEVIAIHIDDYKQIYNYTEFIFNKYNKIIKLTFQEIVNFLNNKETDRFNSNHSEWIKIQETLQWYKENKI